MDIITKVCDYEIKLVLSYKADMLHREDISKVGKL